MCAQCGCTNDQETEDFTINGFEFTSDTEYKNKFLQGRYRLILNGVRKLIFGLDWNYINEDGSGGFKILIPGYVVTDDTVICGEFY